MEIQKIIIYLNLLVWLIPPIRQYRRTFFYYFLLLAISDPLHIFLYQINFIKVTQIYIPISLLVMAAAFNVKFFKKYVSVLLTIVILLVFILKFFPLSIAVTTRILTFIHSLIFLTFIKDFLIRTTKNKEVNFFYFFLTFYEATIILKFFIVIFQVNLGVSYFYLTTAFEILFALYFSLATDEKPIWKVKLVTTETTENSDSPS